ncbi:MAG: ABC transporter ATP-binding protein [Chloroflexota bacterium]|nr:ABC transporter ATP-binding protein [Dehalococcoidia bacterium]MDW8253826.1 ABC transporter ATP-binding protein [Chloroflexota bacterium]
MKLSEPPRRNGGGATVEFRRVTKHYERAADGRTVAAVRDLTLTIQPGEICVFVGPSGCGKTTSLKMVNRLIEPTSGTILIDGVDVMTVDPVTLRRRIGYVIQQVGLFPHRTIAENIATVPELVGWPKAKIRARVDELIALVGLDPDRYRNRYPSQLSGGERQRIGVARAMAIEPPLMLMDEPFGAVDPIVRERLQNEFLDLQRRLGLTVLFVTHDIDEAIKLGSRVAVFQQNGTIAQYSPPAELLMRPANEYVARFVGGDRALKRLAVMRVIDLPLAPVAPVAGGTTLSGSMNVRDALATLLLAPERAAVVHNDAGAPIGVVTLDMIAGALQPAAATAP